MKLKTMVKGGEGREARITVDGVRWKGLRAALERFKDNSRQDNPYVELESKLTLIELDKLMKQYEDSDDVLGNESGKPFIEFLKNRWERIKNTDACYPHNPFSKANQICIELAKALYQVGKIGQFTYHSLLMPDLSMFHSTVTNNHLTNLGFNQYILTDDNKGFIEICPALNHYNNNKRELVLTFLNQNGDRKNLSENEIYRLTRHSEKALKYYQSIRDAWASTDKNMVKTSLQDEMRNGSITVNATYGNDGINLLKSSVLPSVSLMFNHRDDLFDFMTDVLDQDAWQDLLSSFDLEALSKLLLQEKTFDQTIGDASLYDEKGSNWYNKAVLYCLAELYIRNRGQQYYYGSLSGQVAGMFGMVYGFEDKKQAVEKLKAYLISDKLLSEFKQSLDSGEFKDVFGPLFNGVLKKLADRMVEISQLPAAELPSPESHEPRYVNP